MNTNLPKTIGQRSQTCQNLFSACAQSVSSLQPIGAGGISVKLQYEAERFRQWASNLGALAQVRVLLGYRVGELPDIAGLFLRHMDLIESRIEQSMI